MNKKLLIIILALILAIAIVLAICFCNKKNTEENQPAQETETIVEPIEQKAETTPKIKEENIKKESAKPVTKKSETVQKVVEDLVETKPVKDTPKVEPVKNELPSEENVNQTIEIKSTYSSKNSGSVYYRNVYYNIQIKNSANTVKETVNDTATGTKPNTEEEKAKKTSENAIIWR